MRQEGIDLVDEMVGNEGQHVMDLGERIDLDKFAQSDRRSGAES